MNLKFNCIKVSIYSFLLVSFFANAQKSAVQLGAHYHYGFLLNHNPGRTNIEGPVLKPVSGFELTALWQTNGKRPWHKYYGFPKWGLSAMYFNIGSKNTYIEYSRGNLNKYDVNWGDCYALLVHSSLKPLTTRFLELNIRLGTGLGYFTEVFDEEDNQGNLWISGRLNSAMHMNLEAQFNLSPRSAIVLGGAFTHFSNGATRMPNLGVNFPTLNIGYRYTPFPDYIKIKRDSVYPAARKNYFHFLVAGGAKVLAEFGTTYYPTYAASAQYGRRINKISKLLVSLDAFRDESLLGDSLKSNVGKDLNRYGIWLGHEWMHGRLGLVFGWGYYFYKKTDRDANNYIKVGLRHYFHKNIFGGLTLKTHYGQADCFEWTIGATL